MHSFFVANFSCCGAFSSWRGTFWPSLHSTSSTWESKSGRWKTRERITQTMTSHLRSLAYPSTAKKNVAYVNGNTRESLDSLRNAFRGGGSGVASFVLPSSGIRYFQFVFSLNRAMFYDICCTSKSKSPVFNSIVLFMYHLGLSDSTAPVVLGLIGTFLFIISVAVFIYWKMCKPSYDMAVHHFQDKSNKSSSGIVDEIAFAEGSDCSVSTSCNSNSPVRKLKTLAVPNTPNQTYLWNRYVLSVQSLQGPSSERFWSWCLLSYCANQRDTHSLSWLKLIEMFLPSRMQNIILGLQS